MFFMGASEFLVLIMTPLFGGSGMLGLPPAERDPALLKTAPADALVYVEWAERSGGTPGAEGIDGLAADPEIRLFLRRVESAILDGIAMNVAADDPEARIVADAVPPLVKRGLLAPACLHARFDTEAAAKALETSGQLGPAAAALGIEAAFVVNAGEHADEVAEHVQALTQLLPPEARGEDLKHQRLPLPLPAAHLEVHRHGTYFLVCFGKPVADRTVAALDGKAEGERLAESERFQKALERVAIDRTASVGWADVKGVLDAVVQSLGFQGQMVKSVSEATGLESVDSIVSVSGVVDGRIATRTFVATGGRTDGVFALAAGRSITPEDLAVVPGDADFLSAFSIDAPKVLTATREVVAKAEPSGVAVGAMNSTLRQLEEELGFTLEEDVFPAFGDVWIVFDSPSAGGVLISSLTASLEVEDHEKAKPVFERLMKVLDGTLPPVEAGEYRRHGAVLQKETFLGHEIHFVNTFDDDMPFAPAFCLTEKQLLAAPHPQALKAHVRFLAEEDADTFAAKLGKAVPVPEGEGLLSVSYFDARTGIRLLNAFLPYVAQSASGAMQSQGGTFNAFAVPSGRALLPYVKDSHSTCTRTPEGLLFESHNGVPVPGATSLLVNVPMFGVMSFRRLVGQLDARELPGQLRLQAAPAAAVGVLARPAMLAKPPVRPRRAAADRTPQPRGD